MTPGELDQLVAVRELLNAVRDSEGPALFTETWQQLPADDPRRYLPLVLAALEVIREQHIRDLETAMRPDPNARWLDMSSAVRAAHDRARRRLTAAVEPRPGDYLGGPLDWATGQPLHRRRAA